mgnify:CR=1 FL=1
MRKVIISLAPVQAGTSVDAVKLAEDVEKSVKLGAAMCHLHCRKPDGSLTPDISYMSECFDEILKRTDVVVQASTGGVSDMNIQERCNPLDYPKVESASLNGGSTNLGEAVYVNSFDDIRYCADAVYKRGILPETEVFDIGMLHNMAVVKSEQPFADPMLFTWYLVTKAACSLLRRCWQLSVPLFHLMHFGALPTLDVITGHSWPLQLLWEQR